MPTVCPPMPTDAHCVPLADCISPGKCAPSPATTILEQRNPTCDIRNYQGGQWACHHMWSLLDKEQPIPWADQPLVFQHKCAKVPSNATARPFNPTLSTSSPPPSPLAPSTQPPPLQVPPLLTLSSVLSHPPSIASLALALRWRFWVQPYDPSYHTALTLGESVGSAILLGSPWEYDVPKCEQGVPGCSWECGLVSPGCTWVHTVTGSHMGRHTFVAFNPQCV